MPRGRGTSSGVPHRDLPKPSAPAIVMLTPVIEVAMFLRPLVFALCAAIASPAAAYISPSNNQVVEPRGGDRFVVPYRGASGARAFWCAAGEYVIYGLGLPPTTAIWRTSEPPRRSGEGIAFALTPENAASASGLLRISLRGPSLSAAGARSLCSIDRFFDDR